MLAVEMLVSVSHAQSCAKAVDLVQTHPVMLIFQFRCWTVNGSG